MDSPSESHSIVPVSRTFLDEGAAEVWLPDGLRPGDGGHHAHGFIDAFLVFARGDGVGDDAGAGLDVGFAVLEDDGAQGDAGVGVSVEAEVANGAGVDA